MVFGYHSMENHNKSFIVLFVIKKVNCQILRIFISDNNLCFTYFRSTNSNFYQVILNWWLLVVGQAIIFWTALRSLIWQMTKTPAKTFQICSTQYQTPRQTWTPMTSLSSVADAFMANFMDTYYKTFCHNWHHVNNDLALMHI